MPRNVTLAATWRYFSGTKLDNNNSDPDLLGSKYSSHNVPIIAEFGAQLPSGSYLDLSGSWDISKNVQIHGGINNVFDKDPPIINTEIASGGSPNYPEAYDGLGRQLFIGITAKY
jgi:outer membrane receptor for ferrienterochelin and colicin